MAGTLTLDSWPGSAGFTTASYLARFLEQMQYGMLSAPGVIPQRSGDYGGTYANEFKVTADSSGMVVHVAGGRITTKGILAKIPDASLTAGVYDLTVTTAHASQQRVDRVIVRFDLTTGAATLRMLDGTTAAAGSAVPAALTQNSSTWEECLAIVVVDAAATTIANIDVVDTRRFSNPADLQARALLAGRGIVNGGLEIWNEGTSFTSAANGQYGPEMFLYSKVGAVVHDMAVSTDLPTIADNVSKEASSLLLDVTTADASIAATDLCLIRSFVEGYRFKPFAQRAFSIPFWVKASKIGIHSVAVMNSGRDRAFVGTYFIEAVNTWELHWINVPASPAAGTWDYTNGTGLRIDWILAAGSNFHVTPNSWQTVSSLATYASSRQVNELDSTANNFRLALIGPLQLGGIPLPFGREENVEQETQRYYCKTFDRSIAPAQNTGSTAGCLYSMAFVAGASGTNWMTWRFPAPMRTAPSVTGYSPSSATAGPYNASSSLASGATIPTNLGQGGASFFNGQVASDGVGHQLAMHASANARMT